jgi:hypothetical protein
VVATTPLALAIAGCITGTLRSPVCKRFGRIQWMDVKMGTSEPPNCPLLSLYFCLQAHAPKRADGGFLGRADDVSSQHAGSILNDPQNYDRFFFQASACTSHVNGAIFLDD